ncbi:MAG: hypothetical protein ABI921_02045 [Panacibacter sp.]
MNNLNTPLTIYQENINAFQKQLIVLKQKKARIGWLRLFVVVATALSIYLTWHSETWLTVSLVIAGIGCFLYFVSIDTDTKNTIANLERLLAINNEEVKILNGDYYKREDGKNLEPEHHTYAQDLDIFGTASIYQYINRCTAEQSKKQLAKNLLQPQQKERILQTQQAVKEFTEKINWRQQFQSYGIENAVTINTEQRIINWLQQPASFRESYWKWLSLLFPVFTLGCTVLYVFDIINSAIYSMIVFVCFLFAGSLSKKIHATYVLLSRTVTEVDTLYRQLDHLEKENFTSEFIVAVKHSIESKDAHKASVEIYALKNILNRFDVRLNIFAFFFLNTFLLWDLWQILALNQWKNKNQQSVSFWFKAIAETEVISSLASLSFNQPAWCYPEIAGAHFTLQGKEIGHPLIAANKRVDNSFTIEGTAKIALITGSNMGGKSTFLRSIGVNTVLALMGAPVCAINFTVSPVQLLSSMRIADNLAENTSTFYAELKKLQQIIEAVNRKEKVFILLDEILRGTNSFDRHTGSKALIKQLIQQHAVAVIATHDVELTVLENDFPESIANYHFDVQVDKNDELFFDFKLKDGICKSMNASILMKKIGIEIA